jgi:molecular chaperone DnaK
LAVRKAAEGEDAAAIRGAVERLTGLSHKLAEELYKKTAGAGETSSAPGADVADTPPGASAPRADEVVDAEVVDKQGS